MKTHLYNKNLKSDDLYIDGDLKYLVIGNSCRSLDHRRTPGFIKHIDFSSGYFHWEIADFEDKGKHWEVPFENILNYQFDSDSIETDKMTIENFRQIINSVKKNIQIIPSDMEIKNFKKLIQVRSLVVASWLESNSIFFEQNTEINFQDRSGPELLRSDFNKYMKQNDLSVIELKTSESQVLNPFSGDWITALQIVMAEMGFKIYNGQDVRAQNYFQDVASKENFKKYIEHRMGFLGAVFNKLKLSQVELFRGMKSEFEWENESIKESRFWSSWTFNRDVAHDFSDLNISTKNKNSYLIKRAISTNKLFMTYLETDSMNAQYQEAEAIVLHDEIDQRLW